MKLPKGKKIYFASDQHLGAPNREHSIIREKHIVKWLDIVSHDAHEIYLLGDLFDFWFEYKKVVPRGFVRILGKLAELSDNHIPITIFTGNHDMWMLDYLENEIGVQLHRKPIQVELQGKKFLIGHGDGLGPGDKGYKRLKKVFANPTCRWLFSQLHPDLAFRIASFWSGKSREYSLREEFLGVDREWLVRYAEKKLESQYFDYFVFGHRHLPIQCTLSNGQSTYFNLGDWMHYYSYGVLENGQMNIEFYVPENENRLVVVENL
jgi:UDP-2,3-diacylglucosamine hydrolase